MKPYIKLIVISFFVIFQQGILWGMETQDSKTQQTLLNWLTLKFSYDGQELAEKIETIKDQEEFKNLPKVSVYSLLNELKHINNQISSEHQGATVYLPFPDSDEDYSAYLIGSAYFPRELDPQRLLFSQLCDLEHIHLQLAYAVHYKHPRPAHHLKDMLKYCGLRDTPYLWNLLTKAENEAKAKKRT